ncbi:hypothetical protein AAFF_G00209700 [Aldrovandia affinis]|uniref:DDE Tnp4 domain-containing protein n=1 Tax=Aldrovandia affinis TaxID=143900 RepID=A0AAD7SW70_9TELE|nr:hypothetical protein AAFF_G00209700 [Aldrovandia affinis]
MFLWYLANQNSFRELSDKFDVSQGAAHKVIVEVLDLTCLLASSFITWPTHCEKRTNAVLFRRACGIDGIVGAIDGCHIRIQGRQGWQWWWMRWRRKRHHQHQWHQYSAVECSAQVLAHSLRPRVLKPQHLWQFLLQEIDIMVPSN